MQENNDHYIVEKAVNLSLIEVFLGSFLHAIKLPFTGQMLSLNQGFFLTRYLRDFENRFAAFKGLLEVSLVVSIMKALAPAGKKFGPMISISMQGFLYSISILLFGKNILGQIIGMVLLSLWAFVQPFITYFLIYGSDLLKAFDYFSAKMNKYLNVSSEILLNTILLVIGIKVLLAICIPFISKSLRDDKFRSFESFLSQFIKTRPKKVRTPLKGAISDLFRPAVLLSFLTMGLFFFLTNSDYATIFWKILRAVSVAFLLFFMARSPFLSKNFERLAKRSSFLRRIHQLSVSSYSKLSEKLG